MAVSYKVMMPLPECQHIAKFLLGESDRGLISCNGKFFKPLDKSCQLGKKQLYNFYQMTFILSFKLLLTYCTVWYKFSMNIMLTIFDVSIKEKRVVGSLCFELLLSK